MDTPGLFDTTMTDQEVKRELARSMGMTAPGPHIILLTINVGRFTKEDYDAVKHFDKHFGDGIYNYLIVVFTKADSLTEENVHISDYVNDCPQSLKDILQLCENRYIGFNNSLSGNSRDRLVEQLIEKVDEVLQRNHSSSYTNEIYKEAKRLKRLEEDKQMREAEERSCIENEMQQSAPNMVRHRNHQQRSYEETRLRYIPVENSRDMCVIL